MGDVPINGGYSLERLGNSDLWFRTERIPKDARFGYELCDNVHGCSRDPLNPSGGTLLGVL